MNKGKNIGLSFNDDDDSHGDEKDTRIEPVLIQPESKKQLEEFRKLWKPVDMDNEAKEKRRPGKRNGR